MPLKFLKISLAIVVIIIIAIGYLYLTGKMKFNNEQDEEIAEINDFSAGENIETEPEENETAESSDWKTYRNDEYGFSLNFPESWSGYKITTHKPEHQTDICFFIKEKGELSFCLFQIIVYTKEQWDLFKEKSPQIIQDNENSKYFFRYSYMKDVSKTKNCENQELSQFQCDRSREAHQILSTFKFTK